MAKVHMISNKALACEPIALCASQMTAAGKVRYNARRSYSTMGSPMVRPRDFITTDATQRCAHCVDVLRQRKAMFPKTYAAICETPV